MTYKIKLSELKAIPGCKTEWQIGGSYCAWAKIARAATGETSIATSPCYAELGIGEITPPAQRFFKAVREAIGDDKFQAVVDLNDAQGKWQDTHEAAVSYGIEYGVLAGIFQLEVEEALETEEACKEVVA